MVPFISVKVMSACSVLGLVDWSSCSRRGVADENMGFSEFLTLVLPPIWLAHLLFAVDTIISRYMQGMWSSYRNISLVLQTLREVEAIM